MLAEYLRQKAIFFIISKAVASFFQPLMPADRKERNFFEICGYPHYENITSNILSFFFDSEAEHNLRELLTKSLIDSGIPQKIGDLHFSVEREVKTDKGGFIDILMYNDSHCLVIENKLIITDLGEGLVQYGKIPYTQG